jgi:uncharacterized protein YoxC
MNYLTDVVTGYLKIINDANCDPSVKLETVKTLSHFVSNNYTNLQIEKSNILKTEENNNIITRLKSDLNKLNEEIDELDSYSTISTAPNSIDIESQDINYKVMDKSNEISRIKNQLFNLEFPYYKRECMAYDSYNMNSIKIEELYTKLEDINTNEKTIFNEINKLFTNEAQIYEKFERIHTLESDVYDIINNIEDINKTVDEVETNINLKVFNLETNLSTKIGELVEHQKANATPDLNSRITAFRTLRPLGTEPLTNRLLIPPTPTITENNTKRMRTHTPFGKDSSTEFTKIGNPFTPIKTD